MKAIANLEKDILNITMKIYYEFPELTKYITEMPAKVSEKNNIGIYAKNLDQYFNSLTKILKDYTMTNRPSKVNKMTKLKIHTNPLVYQTEEDIYNQSKEEQDINPEDTSKTKTSNENESGYNEKSFKNDMSGDDLDVPGSELDDQQESVGSEDEENNYYSIGGDNHNNLDEDNG
jgi:uncharacterized protein YdaU (DUF1376 family)